MPDLPISGLPVVTALSSSYLIPAVSGSVTAQMTLAQVGAAISGSYVTVDGTQTIAGSKTFSANQLILAPASSGGVLNLKQDAYLGSTNGYTSLASDGTNIAIIAANGAITNKQAVLDLSSLTNNTLRTYTFPNKNGTVAMLSDITSSGTTFPYTGSAIISGSMQVTGSLNVSGSATIANTVIAKRASIFDANYNTIIGDPFDITGVNNIVLGDGGLLNGTLGSQNIAVGFSAQAGIISGSGNISMGQYALEAYPAIIVGQYTASSGSYNTAIGNYAMRYVAQGSYNVALGEAALQGFTSRTGSASYNVALGVSASYSASSAVNNVTIGYKAGSQITVGSYNTIIGSFTGSSNLSNTVVLADGQGNIGYKYSNSRAEITGSLNVIGSTNISGSFTVTGSIIGNVSASGQVIGGVLGRFNNVLIYSTLAGTGTGSIKITTGNAISVDGGSWNTVLGAGAYFGADPNTPGTGSRNTAIGVSASYNNFIGQDNVAIGYQALANNTGSQNIAIGNGALYNTLGDPYGYYGNIAIGYSASYSHKAGSSNVAVGNYELSSLTTGSWNIAVGGGSYVTQGDYNVSLGGLGPVSGSWNTAINSAGGNLVTGSGNTFVGNIAGFNHVYGYYNTALGYGAMFKQHTIYLLTPPTQSSYNIAVGYQSMYSQEGGFHNVAIGSSALNGSSSFSQNTGSYNVAIGYSASYNNTIGIRNTTIGYSAGSSITTGNYNTILGSTTGSTTLTGTVLIADGQGNLAMKATGSAVTLYNVLQLPTQHPLPAASSYPNSFAVSASSPTKPYYSDGTNWNALY